MGTYQEIGSRRELLVDTTLVDALSNTTLKLHEPVSAGTASSLLESEHARIIPALTRTVIPSTK